MFADTLLTVRGALALLRRRSPAATQPVNGEYGAAIYYVKLQ